MGPGSLLHRILLGPATCINWSKAPLVMSSLSRIYSVLSNRMIELLVLIMYIHVAN